MEVNFLTVAQFAKKIKMHPITVRKAIKNGTIFASKINLSKKSHYRIAESELERLQLKGMCEGQKK